MREQPDHRISSSLPESLVQANSKNFVATALEYFCVAGDFGDKPIPFRRRPGAAAFHALARLLAFRRGRISPGIQSLLGGIGINDKTFQIVSRLTGHKHKHYGVIRTGGTSCFNMLLFLTRPAVMNPDRNRLSINRGRCLVAVYGK